MTTAIGGPICRSYWANPIYNEFPFDVTCDADGDFDFVVVGATATTWIEITGYSI